MTLRLDGLRALTPGGFYEGRWSLNLYFGIAYMPHQESATLQGVVADLRSLGLVVTDESLDYTDDTLDVSLAGVVRLREEAA